MIMNRKIVLARRPSGTYVPEDLRMEEVACPTPGPGEMLVRILYCSLAPMQRQRMSDVPSYVRPFDIGEVIASDVVGRVEASNNASFAVGDHVIGRLGLQDYAVCNSAEVEKIDSDDNPALWLSMLGSPGLTAYIALYTLGLPAPAETVVVTSAAGAVGSYVCQLAKLSGARVVGIAGDESKLALAKSYGCDAVVSYKESDFLTRLEEAVPRGVDVFFDLVGGTTADAVFERLAQDSRVVLCGRLSTNNSLNPSEDFANLRHIWLREATIRAFSLYSHKPRFQEVRQKLKSLHSQGKLVSTENLLSGLDNIPTIFASFLKGDYNGRIVIKLHD